MDEMADRERVTPVALLRCPRCGEKAILRTNHRFECPNCGELYFDDALGIWRVRDPKSRNFYNDYNDRDVK